MDAGSRGESAVESRISSRRLRAPILTNGESERQQSQAPQVPAKLPSSAGALSCGADPRYCALPPHRYRRRGSNPPVSRL